MPDETIAKIISMVLAVTAVAMLVLYIRFLMTWGAI